MIKKISIWYVVSIVLIIAFILVSRNEFFKDGTNNIGDCGNCNRKWKKGFDENGVEIATTPKQYNYC